MFLFRLASAKRGEKKNPTNWDFSRDTPVYRESLKKRASVQVAHLNNAFNPFTSKNAENSKLKKYAGYP